MVTFTRVPSRIYMYVFWRVLLKIFPFRTTFTAIFCLLEGRIGNNERERNGEL